MTTGSSYTPIVQAVDKETIRTLASLPLEKQTFVKGIIIGLRNQIAPTPPATPQPRVGRG